MYRFRGKNVVELGNIYGYCSVANAKPAQGEEPVSRSFEEIPGPRSLPLVGTLHKYLPIFGEYSFDRIHETGLKKLKQYGPLVREEIVPGVNTVWLFNPEDIRTIYRMDSNRYPERRSHLALYKYRKDNSSEFKSAGLLPTNGSEWWELRKEVQKTLSKPQIVMSYAPDLDKIIMEFRDFCRVKEEYADFLPFLARLFLETVCSTTFNLRLDSFSEKEMRDNSRCSRLIEAAKTSNSSILRLDNGPMLWKYFKTPLYSKFSKAQDYIRQVAVDLISQKMHDSNAQETHKGTSLLETFLNNPALDYKDVVAMSTDMILAGIDTTSYSIGFAMYHLAKNEDCQNTLRREANLLLKEANDAITIDVLHKATYAKAVIKESLRLNPISVGIGRILQSDAVLSGYHVPKGVVAVTQNQIICRQAQYFQDPDEFKPERWLKTDGKEKIDPFLSLPFGHGPRACIAKRLAELNMQIFLLRMYRNHKFTWLGGKLNCKSLLINVPDAPLHFKIQQC